ncbi:MAG: hypothetical protein EPN34_07070 [Burkholderiaceae bacterium]|nr:MAG: hypothetical protein EPN34_07070 [Burkholderiaceae bacterium]
MEERLTRGVDFDANQAMAQLDSALRCAKGLHDAYERLLATGFVPEPIALGPNALAWPLPGICVIVCRRPKAPAMAAKAAAQQRGDA